MKPFPQMIREQIGRAYWGANGMFFLAWSGYVYLLHSLGMSLATAVFATAVTGAAYVAIQIALETYREYLKLSNAEKRANPIISIATKPAPAGIDKHYGLRVSSAYLTQFFLSIADCTTPTTLRLLRRLRLYRQLRDVWLLEAGGVVVICMSKDVYMFVRRCRYLGLDMYGEIWGYLLDMYIDAKRETRLKH